MSGFWFYSLLAASCGHPSLPTGSLQRRLTPRPTLLQPAPRDTPAPPPKGYPQHLLLPILPQSKALIVLGVAWTLCSLPLLTGLFSTSLRVNLTPGLRTVTLCTPRTSTLTGKPTAWWQSKRRCQGKGGYFSGKVGAGLPLLTGRPDGI